MFKIFILALIIALSGCASTYNRTVTSEPFIILDYSGYPYVFATLQNTRTGEIFKEVFLGRNCQMNLHLTRQMFYVQLVTYTQLNTSVATSNLDPSDLAKLCPKI